MWLVNKVEIHFEKNGILRLQMIQFECPRIIHPFVSSTFGVHCGVPFSLYAGKEKCCMWLVKKVEIHFAKMGFLNFK